MKNSYNNMDDGRTQQSLQHLTDALVERRSDIAEILEDILDGKVVSKVEMERRLEGRVSEFRVTGYDYVQYDTLTTLLEPVGEDGYVGQPCPSVYEGEKKPDGWLKVPQLVGRKTG